MGDAGPGQCPGGGSLSAELEPCPVLRPASRHCPHPPTYCGWSCLGGWGPPRCLEGLLVRDTPPPGPSLGLSVCLSQQGLGGPLWDKFPCFSIKGLGLERMGGTAQEGLPSLHRVVGDTFPCRALGPQSRAELPVYAEHAAQRKEGERRQECGGWARHGGGESQALSWAICALSWVMSTAGRAGLCS